MKLQRQTVPDTFPVEYLDEVYADNSLDNELETTESDLPQYMEELDDFSLRITLSTGVVVVLRDMTADDIIHLNKIRKGVPHPTIKGRTVELDEVELLKRLISFLCIQWGEKSSVTPPEIGRIRVKDLGRLSKALEHFQSVQ